jgi:RNA polymerase sigma-54 factor
MSTKMLLTARLDQRLVMSQQLTQAITLLQYTTLDLKQIVKQYIETNPLIDVDEHEPEEQTHADENQSFQHSAASRKISRYNKDNVQDDNTLENYSIPKGLREHLLEQTLLCKFNPLEQQIAEGIIDAIDENGYLSMSADEIQQILQTADASLVETVIKKVQSFEPPGIACRDMRECLSLQLQFLAPKDDTHSLACDIISHHFELLALRNVKVLVKKLGVNQEQYNAAMALIRSLNPKPGLQYSNEIEHNMEPELHIKKIKDKWCVFLNESILTNVKINQTYHEAIKSNRKHASYEALSKELQEAQWLLKGLQRRNETLLKVATHIIKLQHDFIEHGQAFMKPMNIIDVSQALELHESTVSRVTSGKYISTPRGVFELKYFFPSYVLTESGETCSDTAVKEFIKEIIGREAMEHKYYSDGEIAALLKEKGIHIARRTVAKYRDALRILPSQQRAQSHGGTRNSNLKTQTDEPIVCSD